MRVNDKAELRARLFDWIYQANPKIKDGELHGSTPILKEGMLNSIQLMDLLLYIERLSENPIEIDSLNPQSFQSVDSIYETFFKENHHESQRL